MKLLKEGIPLGSHNPSFRGGEEVR